MAYSPVYASRIEEIGTTIKVVSVATRALDQLTGPVSSPGRRNLGRKGGGRRLQMIDAPCGPCICHYQSLKEYAFRDVEDFHLDDTINVVRINNAIPIPIVHSQLKMESDRYGLLFEFERREHWETVEEANHRIEELEAQIAIREMELETCIGLPSQGVPEGDNGSRLPAPKIPTKVRSCAKPISDDDCLRVLESNMLDITRGSWKRLDSRRPDCRPEALQSTVRLNHPTLEPSPLLPSQNNALQHRPFTTEPFDSPSAMLAIVQLKNHICEMSAQVEAAKTERQALVATAARQRRETSGMGMHNKEDVLRIGEECVRLSAPVYYLQEQMDKAKVERKFRESGLLKEIEVLRSRVRRTSSLLVPVDASITEGSMELATPLQPTLLLSTRSHDTPPEPVDSSLIPLPFSPGRTSSPTVSTGLASSRSPTSLDIRRVQNAFTIARENLAQKEGALVQLRTEVEDLRRQIPHPSPPQDG
ncbi:hypothetical protein EDC04DRAFT_2908271 [Pisolithus marmoratus]|nr:hypothetical protein EDC04DRAFT_2908271 [Pisolithus marmoratus]